MQGKENCLQARFFGRVQGVGFRYFVQEKAQELGLKGWVRNCKDESVELEAFGERKNLELFLKIIQEQHAFARVDRVEKNYCSRKGSETGFSIKF